MEAAEAPGIGFANLNAAFDPETIVVSDYIAPASDLIGEHVWQCVRKRSPNRHLTHFHICLRPPRMGLVADGRAGSRALALSFTLGRSGTLCITGSIGFARTFPLTVRLTKFYTYGNKSRQSAPWASVS